MTKLITKYNWTSVGLFVGVIIVAHLFTTNPYDWKTNTISELASQHYQYRWIMKIGFILFGGILLFGITNKLINGNGNVLTELPVLIYGLAILISGLYSTKPIVDGIEYAELESKIHSYAAQIAGMTFSGGLLIYGFTETNTNLKIIHFVTFAFVVGCSALFGIMDSHVGIIQRVMYVGSFVWLTLFYNQINEASGQSSSPS
ncbi:DUF998 domain-containing protein [Cyclobacterium xiamenense]|uniref:DUF998 domain-containing protein n=1 Tax=Cyclobacterium xiamenense TaxID=1297121 RepID=UPI0035CEC944